LAGAWIDVHHPVAADFQIDIPGVSSVQYRCLYTTDVSGERDISAACAILLENEACTVTVRCFHAVVVTGDGGSGFVQDSPGYQVGVDVWDFSGINDTVSIARIWERGVRIIAGQVTVFLAVNSDWAINLLFRILHQTDDFGGMHQRLPE